MISKFNYNLRVKGYKLMGILWYITPIVILGKFLYKNNDWEAIGIATILYFIFWVVSGLLRYGAHLEIMSISKLLRKPKLIFHDQLGYFSLYFFESDTDKDGNDEASVEIYKQSILCLSKIDKFKIYTQEQIQKNIKDSLDQRYSEKLKISNSRKEKEEKDKVAKSTLDGWDGYLTTVGRRDEKIKSIMKK